MIEELHRFLLVAKEKNITKTAGKLFLTQSALSQSLHRLEKALHTKLYRQQGKQFVLTQEGQSLVTLGEKILTLWGTAQNPDRLNECNTVYSIGLFDNGALLLGDYLRENMHTDISDLELTIDRSTKLISQLSLGTIDLAVCVQDESSLLPKHVHQLHTFDEQLIPVSAHTFSQNIEQIPFILYNNGSHTRKQIDMAFIRAGIKPLVFAESTSVSFMKELALQGAGVALLPENLIRIEMNQGMLREQYLPFNCTRTFGIYTHDTSPLHKNHVIVRGITEALANQKTKNN